MDCDVDGVRIVLWNETVKSRYVVVAFGAWVVMSVVVKATSVIG